MTSIPKKVFIVPYRNRVQHKFFFSKYMTFLLEDCNDYEIYFSHQCDNRSFNRGAAKNIGFMAIKEKYPDNYKDITFIFNDVDTIPFNKIFDYETTQGTVKHYYGYKYALGGIVVIKGSDFDLINGFPCFWGWGMEDNCLQKRCDAYGLNIDRSTFYAIGSPQILQLFDGISRIISKKDPWRMQNDTGQDGIRTIHSLKYSIDEKSTNPNDNIFTIANDRIKFINIETFQPLVPFAADNYTSYDLREPQRKIENPQALNFSQQTPKQNNQKKVNFVDSDWTQIPYYPTKKERKEQIAQDLIRRGKQVPVSLQHEIHKHQMEELKSDAYNSNENVVLPPQPPSIHGITYRGLQQHQIPSHTHAAIIHQQRYQQQQQLHQQYQQYPQHPPKPRAQASARIRLGGVY